MFESIQKSHRSKRDDVNQRINKGLRVVRFYTKIKKE